MLIGIVAMTKDGLIGKGNGLPWHIPADLRFFKEVTDGSSLIVGRATYEGLPNFGKDRSMIVFTSQSDYKVKRIQDLAVTSIQEIVDLAFSPDKYFLIGGVMMYKLFSHMCKYFYITTIEESSNDYEGDKYFPLEVITNDFKLLQNTLVQDIESGDLLSFKLYHNLYMEKGNNCGVEEEEYEEPTTTTLKPYKEGND